MKLFLQKISLVCLLMQFGSSAFAMIKEEEPAADDNFEQVINNPVPTLEQANVSRSKESSEHDSEILDLLAMPEFVKEEEPSADDKQSFKKLVATLEQATLSKRKKSPKKQLFFDLCDAASDLNLDKVKEFVRNGASIECGKKSSLHRVIDGLVNKMYRIIEWDNNNKEIEKAKQKANSVLEFLIDAGANVNIRDKAGATLLVHASFYAQADNIALLLKHGADKYIPADDSLTAWHNAAERSDSFTKQYMSQTGDPLYFILFSYEKYKEDRQRCIDLLKPEEGSPLYESYCRYQAVAANEDKIERLSEAASKLDHIQVKQILEEGIDFQLAKKDWHLSPVYQLLWGTAYGFIDYVKNIKKSITLVEAWQLVVAASDRSKEITQLLVENGLNVDTPGFWGQTALMVASLTANNALVQKLLELNAQKNALDLQGNNAVAYADINSPIVQDNLKDKEFGCFVKIYSLLSKSDKLVVAVSENDTKLLDGLLNNVENLIPYKAALQEIYALLQEKETEKN